MRKAIKLLAMMVGMLLIVGLFMMAVIQIGGQNSVDSLGSLSQFLDHQKFLFTVFRLSMIIIVFWQWEKIIHWLARKKQWDKEISQLLLTIKWKIAGWILLFELIVNQNILAYLLN